MAIMTQGFQAQSIHKHLREGFPELDLGGFGTRLRDYFQNIPDPMVIICYWPIMWHLIKEFILAVGGNRVELLNSDSRSRRHLYMRRRHGRSDGNRSARRPKIFILHTLVFRASTCD